MQYFIASRVCSMQSMHTAGMLTRANSPWFILVNVGTFIVTIAGVWVAVSNWNRSREDHPDRKEHLRERGEGRTRFLAMAGLLTSAGFIVAFLFIFAEMYAAPLCLK